MIKHHKKSLSLIALSSMFIAACSNADNQQPPVLKVLEQQGLVIVQEFDAGSGLRAFAAAAGDQPIAVYVTGDGNAIVGTRLDKTGSRIDEAMLKELVSKPMGEQEWSRLESSKWVLDGKADAPRIVYTFSDPNCPYCNRFWEAARPWVDSGKVQLRHVLVGIIRADSPNKAAAILDASDRSAALLENEHNFTKGGIKPADKISVATNKALEEHLALMHSLGFRGTPGIVVRQEDGSITKFNGMPQPASLVEVFGKR